MLSSRPATKHCSAFAWSAVSKKRETVQPNHVFSENLPEIFAGGVFGGPFNGFLLVSTAEHLKLPHPSQSK